MYDIIGYMGKLKKEKKKEKEEKRKRKQERLERVWTLDDKKHKVGMVITKMEQLGIHTGVIDGSYKELLEVMRKYVYEDVEFVGKIGLTGTKRIAECVFRNQQIYPINIVLRYNK